MGGASVLSQPWSDEWDPPRRCSDDGDDERVALGRGRLIWPRPRKRRLAAPGRHGAVRCSRWPTCFSSTRRRWSTDTASHPGQAAITMHPEQPGRITAIERALSARDWLGFGVSGSRRRSVGADRGASRALCRVNRASVRVRRGVPRRRHRGQRAIVRGGACMRRAGRCGWSSCCWTGRHRRRSARTGPPVTTPCRPRRWGSACSTTSPSPRDTRSTCGSSSG